MSKSRTRIIFGAIILIVAVILAVAYINHASNKQAENDKASAKAAVESFYKELKNGNYDVVKTAMVTDDVTLKDKPLMTDVKSGEPLKADEKRLAAALINHATYVINDVKLDKTVRSDKTPRMTVSGTVIVSDLIRLYYKDSVDELRQKSRSGMFKSQAEVDAYATQYLWSAVENGTAATKQQSYTLTLIKQADGSWKIQRDSGLGIVGFMLTNKGGVGIAEWFNKTK